MKFSIYPLVVALAAIATAQTFDVEEEMNEFDAREALKGNPSRCNKVAKKVPKCARPAIEKCNRKQGCSTLDYKCGCKHQTAITNCARTAVIKACGQAKALKAQKAALAICKCVNK